jgi:beta-glucosidase
VLLVNRGVLPLGAGVASIAVIGTARDDARFVIGGSAALRLPEEGASTPLAAIAARAGGSVVFSQGSLGDVRLPLMPWHGVRAEYWDGAGEPARVATEAALDVPATPEGLGTPWSGRWTGAIVPERDGPHRFSLTFAGIAALYVDDVLVARGAREAARMIEGPEYPLQALVDLRAGRATRLRVEYETGPALIAPQAGLHGPQVQLGWQPPDGRIDDAAQAAGACDVAIVVVSDSSGEAMDRASLALPGDQDRLVAAVAAASPRTVVVLNTGGPVLMPWLGDVAAVLHVGYPGQRFGAALAAVLFGDADPGGRLPVTFPAAEDDGPVGRPEQYPGVDGDARYDEGLDVGYRHYDRHDRRPLFPFGHGLSYGDYRYSGLEIAADPGGVTVSVHVENAGARAGVEVVQLYVASPPEARQPPKQLKAFRKLSLAAGETSRVSLRVERDDLAAFAAGGWTVFAGRYEALVGRSAGDVRARGSFALDG